MVMPTGLRRHVSPIWEDENIVGFMSMRRKPTREQIVAAEQTYAEMRKGVSDDLVFEHGVATRRQAGSSLRLAITRASLGSKLILASLTAAVIILCLSTYLLATYLTQALDDSARQQLHHGVGLLRAAVASRLDGARTEAFEYSKLLNDQINDSLGGRHRATRSALEALLASNGGRSGKPLDAFLADLRGPSSIFIRTPKASSVAYPPPAANGATPPSAPT